MADSIYWGMECVHSYDHTFTFIILPRGYGRKCAAFENVPPAPDEMPAREYARNIEMLCSENLLFGHCNQNCPIFIAKNGQPCREWIMAHPEEAVTIVEQWAREHQNGGK